MWSIGVLLTSLMFLSSTSKCQTEAAFQSTDSLSMSSEMSPLNSKEPIKIKMLAPAPLSKKHTRTRQNSRFLRTFQPIELLNLARQSVMDNEIDPIMNFHTRNSFSPYENYGSLYPPKARIDAGNSPIFYIKLPPVPYVFMPGVGYVSPHPYSNSQNMPMGMGGMSSNSVMMPPGIGSFLSPNNPSQETSSEQQNQSVISLPLKFLSNGRPHQIESPKKRKKHPGNKENSSEKQGASLISGGKYSFNGRPTAVFVVRSPARSSSVEKRK